MNETSSSNILFRTTTSWKSLVKSDPGWLGLVALGWLILLTAVSVATKDNYGFHRDELNFIVNARNLAWGYVEYPPLTPFIGWIILQTFGVSIVALRFTAALAVAIAVWLTGMMTRDLGGSRLAQVVAMFATATTPILLFNSRFFSYQTFDYLWWVLIAFLLIRLIKTENPNRWVAIGAVFGLGLMTKYSIPFLAAGIAVGVLLTPARRYLKSPWLWIGAGLTLIIFLPNIFWLIQNDWISLDFQAVTRARNIQVGRTQSFLIDQLYVCANPAALPLWIGALYFLFFKPELKPYRILGWVFVTSFVLFLTAQGRGYYQAGAYPMLIAVGASRMIPQSNPSDILKKEFWQSRKFVTKIFYGFLIGMGMLFVSIMQPIGQVDSTWWRFIVSINKEISEEIGWPELVKEVAKIYSSVPVDEPAHTSIFTGNYGEAGAINLYGPNYGLPEAISTTNTFWLKGYGDPPPTTLIIMGMTNSDLNGLFESCTVAGYTPNPYNITNEETRYHPEIFLCRKLIQPWPEFWKTFQRFG